MLFQFINNLIFKKKKLKLFKFNIQCVSFTNRIFPEYNLAPLKQLYTVPRNHEVQTGKTGNEANGNIN